MFQGKMAWKCSEMHLEDFQRLKPLLNRRESLNSARIALSRGPSEICGPRIPRESQGGVRGSGCSCPGERVWFSTEDIWGQEGLESDFDKSCICKDSILKNAGTSTIYISGHTEKEIKVIYDLYGFESQVWSGTRTPTWWQKDTSH